MDRTRHAKRRWPISPTGTHHPPLGEANTLYRWALFDRAPLPRWVDGRVALLGDAAHPMLPFMAQGATVAVEDAWVVAREVTQKTSPHASRSLSAFAPDRASRVQAGSRANAKTFHKRSRLSQLATYGPMWLAEDVPMAVRKLKTQYTGMTLRGWINEALELCVRNCCAVQQTVVAVKAAGSSMQ